MIKRYALVVFLALITAVGVSAVEPTYRGLHVYTPILL